MGNLEEIKKYNSISLDGDGRIKFFEEKPKHPTSTLTGIALYFYPKSTIPLIKQYIAEGKTYLTIAIGCTSSPRRSGPGSRSIPSSAASSASTAP